jgi:hypothetical protein
MERIAEELRAKLGELYARQRRLAEAIAHARETRERRRLRGIRGPGTGATGTGPGGRCVDVARMIGRLESPGDRRRRFGAGEAKRRVMGPFYTKLGPRTGPVRCGTVPELIYVFGAESPDPVGTVSCVGATPDGIALWRLDIPGIELPRPWIIVARELWPTR